MKIIVTVFLSLFVCIPICHAAQPSSSSINELQKENSFTMEPKTRVEQLERVLILELQRKVHSVLQEEYFVPGTGGYTFDKPFTVKDIQKRPRGGYTIKVEGEIHHDKKTDLVFIWFENTIHRGFVVTKFSVSEKNR
ncbi:hypothetical protein [Paenibacillus montanisoli]|uniref:DUF3888 domain-containing protein n=1 Tax=Paenibacillus montanisoli TaxID=2081970 RepID=A0A328U7H1_9BACL|nr:hypothetical protein [Paenibacillus montanisoli]RAP78470.1 hypothetical protein DL346_08630 [Paenibacillus montanisoli]